MFGPFGTVVEFATLTHTHTHTQSPVMDSLQKLVTSSLLVHDQVHYERRWECEEI